MKNGKPVVLAIYPGTNALNQPPIINTTEMLAREGWKVQFLTIKDECIPPPSFNDKNVEVRYFPINFRSGKDRPGLFICFFVVWACFLNGWRHSPAVVLSCGIRGLLPALVLHLFRRIPYINLQLELYLGVKLRYRFRRVIKALERFAIRRSAFSIIQDENRARMLAEDAGIDPCSILIIPNSPLGSSKPVRTRYFYTRFGIPEQTKILLAPGSIHPNFMSLEIVQAAQSLSREWLTVVHSSNRVDEKSDYMQSLFAANVTDRVLFSLTPVPYGEVQNVFGSATVGLVLYGSVGGANTINVGLASGKLAQFLQLGIPVVVSELPILDDLVKRFKVGISIGSLSELQPALDRILAEYDTFSNGAKLCFDEVFSLETRGQALSRAVERLFS